MKKAKSLIVTILGVSVVIAVLNFFMEGVPLLGIPEIKKIERVVIEHRDYPNLVSSLIA